MINPQFITPFKSFKKYYFKWKNLKSSLFKINSNQLSLNNYYKNNNAKRKPKRENIIKNMTHKNKNNQNFNFFFKLKEKEKIRSKTPYLDQICFQIN